MLVAAACRSVCSPETSFSGPDCDAAAASRGQRTYIRLTGTAY